MGVICGIVGDFDAGRGKGAVKAMSAAMKHRGSATVREGERYIVAASVVAGEADRFCALDGQVRDSKGKVVALEELGRRCGGASPSKLNLKGSFAIACRKGAGRWWLLRDRFGSKPLYYFEGDGHLVFSSELKGLLASGLVPKHLNLLSVDRFLTLRCVPGTDSIIQGVSRVRPGHILEWRDGKVFEHKFSGFNIGSTDVSRDEAARKIRGLLRNAVDDLSGGGDSEALLWTGGLDSASLGALHESPKPVFVELEPAWQREARRAKESARKLGLTLEMQSARRIDEKTFAAAVACLDEPIADASVFPLWLVVEEAAKFGTTLLSGHGADEILGGYPRYHFLQKAHGAQAFVPVSLLGGIQPSLPPNSFLRRGGHYLASIRDKSEAFLSFLSVFDKEERDELYTDAMKSVVYEHGGPGALTRLDFSEADLTRNLLSLDLKVSMPSILLTECDRIAAAHGVEMVHPYVDDALVDYVISLSPKTKFGVRSKRLLRLAMKGVLPGRMRFWKRRGFRIPVEGRVLGVINKVAEKTITQERVEASGLFKWSCVEQTVRRGGHNVFRRRQFWALLMFFAWYREVMES